MNRKRLFWIVVLGLATLWLRFAGLNWGAGSLPHPDEVRIAYAVGDLFQNQGDPKMYAYGHLPIYLEAAVFKVREIFHWLGSDPFTQLMVSGRGVAAVLSIGTVILTGRLAVSLGLPFWCALLAAFGVAFFPLSVQLSQYSTVDAHTAFFTILTLERTLSLLRRRRWTDVVWVAFALGAALACKAASLTLIAAVFFAILPLRRSWKFWTLPLVALAAFSIFEPYAWIRPQALWHDIAEQARWVRGNGPPVFFQQYEDTLKFVFSARDLFFYSVGPVGFLLSLFGFWRSFKNREARFLALWFALTWFLLGTSYAKFSRYWLPLIPGFALYAAWALREIALRFPRIRLLTVVLFALPTFIAGTAVHTIHLQDHPYRITPGLMAHDFTEQRSVKLLFDSIWVGFPPVGGDLGPGRPVLTQFADLFEASRHPGFVTQLAQKLSEADYLIATNQMSIRTSYEQLDRNYVAAQTFEALRMKRLGYEFRGVVTTRALFAQRWVDDFTLDHSIPIYDHPTVFVWKNLERRTPKAIEDAVLDTEVRSPKQSLEYYRCLASGKPDCNKLFPPAPSPASSLSPKPQPTEPELDSILAPQVRYPVIWYLFFLLMGFAAWPLAAALFPGSLAAGYGLARTTGLAFFGYVVWLAGHLPGGLLRGPFVPLFWIVCVGIGLLEGTRRSFWNLARFKEAARIEGITLAVFLLYLTFRLFAPDIFWSENPIDLGYFTSLAKGASLPPVDPGYSGTALNYYYYACFLFALPVKILAIPPNVSYLLAMATVPALMAGPLWTLGASIGFSRPRWLLGLLSVVTVLFCGNWDGISQLVYWLWRRDPYPWVFNMFHSAHELIKYTVHETPIFSYLFVDLHAHLMTGILFVSFLAWLRFSDLASVSRFRAFAGALFLGSMAPANTWDYFTLSVLSLGLATMISLRRKDPACLKKTFLWIALSYLLFLPFHLIFTKKMTNLGIGWVGYLMSDFGGILLAMGLYLTFVILALPRIIRDVEDRKRLVAYSLTLVAFVLSIYTLLELRTPFALLFYSLLGLAYAFVVLRRPLRFPYLDGFLLAFFTLVILSMVEIFVIKDFLQGGEYKRMNTVFKFYYQSWFLFAVASPSLLYAAYHTFSSRWWRSLVVGGASAAIAASMVCTFGSVKARTHEHSFAKSGQSKFTTNGLAWLKQERPHEYRVIAWLWKHGTSDDVLMEASKEDYRYDFNVVSCASGVPSVLSWWSHADQRDRWSGERVPLVRQFYETPDLQVASRILRRLQVTYVYLGDREIEEYGTKGLGKYAIHPDVFVPVVAFPGGTLYRVDL
ncbi:MAG: DUF2298 domain-containing protein [Pseudomonadota bacterium]